MKNLGFYQLIYQKYNHGREKIHRGPIWNPNSEVHHSSYFIFRPIRGSVPINRFRIINRITLHALLYLSCQEICSVWITDCFCYCIIICIILDLTSLECTPKVNIPGPSQRSRMIKSPLMNW